MLQPVLDGRNPAKIVLDVLLADSSYRNGSAQAVCQRRSKDRLTQENTFTVVPKRAMADIGNVRLGLVEPVMYRQVVVGLTAEQARRTDGVMIRVRHQVCLLSNPDVLHDRIGAWVIGNGACVKIHREGAVHRIFPSAEAVAQQH